jgi:phosphatidate cytidylyltransferase
MIRTRVLVGSGLAAAAVALLVGDRYLAPWFPVLFAGLSLVGVFVTRELIRLFPPAFRPPVPFVVAGILLTLAANWYAVIRRELAPLLPTASSPWEPVLFAYIGIVVASFLIEMGRYREPGTAVPRLGLSLLAVSYLALLGSFLVQLRWIDPDPARTSFFLALAIFVPKFGDIGAFFAGTFLGRHQMTPILSPKKTWEGFAGGMLAAALVAVSFTVVVGPTIQPIFPGGILEAAGFGLAVGVAGVFGDLAESLIKRDYQTKDAATSIPGFGGLLDVIDSVLFAAPVAYFWFR